MLTIEECREKLGDIAKDMSDERILEIRDYLTALCRNVIRQELDKHRTLQNEQKGSQ